MVTTKFNIGQRVRHKLLGYLGVIIDVDPEYSLEKPSLDEISAHSSLRKSPWYHVVMEDDEGKPMHTYLAEAQIGVESFSFYSGQSALDELAKSIRRQLQAPRLRN